MYFHHIENKITEPWLMSIRRFGYNRVGRELSVARTAVYPYCNLHYVMEGTMEITYKGKSVRAGAGSVFVLPPFTAHSYRAVSDAVTLRWLEYEGGQSELLTGKLIAAACGVSMSIGDDKDLFEERLSKCLTEERGVYERSEDIYGLLMVVLKGQTSEEGECCKEKDPLSQITNFIEGHLSEDLKNEGLAAIGGFSSSYMSRLFKKTYDMTPGGYIYMRRVAKAKTLLADTTLPLVAIATDCGFYDAPHLVHRFTDIVGMSPQTYRQETANYRMVPVSER